MHDNIAFRYIIHARLAFAVLGDFQGNAIHNATHPRQSFSENELPQVGLEPTTFCVLGRRSTN